MYYDNSFKIAFIVSVICHSLIFFSPSLLVGFMPVKNSPPPLEITYYKIKSQYNKPHKASRAPAVRQAPLKSVPVPVGAAGPKNQDAIQAQQRQKQVERQIQKAPQAAAERSSVVPPNPAGLEKTPAYISYAQSVREKINNTANSGAYRRMRSSGDIFLNFVLISDGALAALQIVDERSCGNQRLKQIAQQAIEDSSPFEPFPQDLEFRQLAFSVVISFE